MNLGISIRALALGVTILFTSVNVATAKTSIQNFDDDWLFYEGDVLGAETSDFDDASWKPIDVPYDWQIHGEFDKHAKATGSGGFLPSGVAWYRKYFTVDEEDLSKKVSIEFDGVMERSGVWINGVHVGYRPNGYSSFRYNLTPYLKAGENIIAVRSDTSFQPASRWYAGGGIYRHVRLITQGHVHVEEWGTFVTTPTVNKQSATVNVDSSILNDSLQDLNVYLQVSIVNDAGEEVANARGKPLTIPAGRVQTLSVDTVVKNPALWDTQTPHLHKAMVNVVAQDGSLLDQDKVTFGIRHIEFKADTGFWLNGKNVKIKGTAIHADGGAFGMAVPLSFYERRLAGLKALGVNGIRTAHHPFSPEFLDLCDRMGFLVMNEAFDMWTVAKTPYDYSLFFTDWSSIDARDFIRRDRNHPSVVIWSMGNEVHDTPYPLVAKSIITRLKKIFNEEDPSRPVTLALFRPNTTGDYENGVADMLDVVGQNYREHELLKAHADKPSRKIIGTENSKNRNSWVQVRDNPAYSGMFLWTGADYLGEADRAGWPYISNPSGLVDRTDFVKPIGWERASWWSSEPVVKIARRITDVIDVSELPTMVGVAMPQPKGPGALNDWSPENRDAHIEKVEVNTNTDEVELFLNGKSLGKKPKNKDDSAIKWEVVYEEGQIEAVGYVNGKAVGSDLLVSAGKPSAIKLVSEQSSLAPGFDNVAFIRVEVVDDKGIRVPTSDDALTIDVSGAGHLAAFDNGSPTDHTPFASKTRQARQGRALAMVRATENQGVIEVTVSAQGLKSGSVSIDAVSSTDPAYRH